MKLVGTPSKDLIDKLSSEEVSPSPQLDNHDWYYHTDSCQTVCLCTQTFPNAPLSCAILPCILPLVSCVFVPPKALASVVSACVALFPWDLSCGLQLLQWNVSFLVCPMYIHTQSLEFTQQKITTRKIIFLVSIYTVASKSSSALWQSFDYFSVYLIFSAITTSGVLYPPLTSVTTVWILFIHK